jgi:CRISPR/Cas system-associated exonuclease Cas4 (RecB family)
VLNAKAGYGSTVHESIELYEINRSVMSESEALYVTSTALDLDYIQTASLNQYLRLKDKYDIEVIEQEKIIHYQDKYAGRFDMIASIQGYDSLCDIKTTAELDKEYLSWQLSLYAYAYYKMYGIEFTKLYAIWLPKKNLGQLIEIDKKSDEEIENLLERFYKNGKE